MTPDPIICRHCGFPREGHTAVNYSTALVESPVVWVCPTALFEPRDPVEPARPVGLTNQPPGTVRVEP